jgi:hypothetical protein
MSEAKHTPGPWFIDESKGPILQGGAKATVGVWAQARFDEACDSDDDEIEPEDEKWVCGAWGTLSHEDIANARLIAAAPDLLEALEDLLSGRDSDIDWRVAARAAIAKAKGEA